MLTQIFYQGTDYEFWSVLHHANCLKKNSTQLNTKKNWNL